MVKNKQIDRILGRELYNKIHNTYIDCAISQNIIKDLDRGLWVHLNKFIVIEQLIIKSLNKK